MNTYQKYEAIKRVLQGMDLTPKQYETLVRLFAEVMRI